MPRKWGTSKNFEKSENLTNICHSELFKNQRCVRGNQRCWALNQRCFRENQRWNSADFELWKFPFSALFRAESALFRDFQVMNSAETDLKVFWIRTDQRWMSLRRQPGQSITKTQNPFFVLSKLVIFRFSCVLYLIFFAKFDTKLTLSIWRFDSCFISFLDTIKRTVKITKLPELIQRPSLRKSRLLSMA